jgi:hypothetical protein
VTGGSGKVVDSGPNDHIFVFYSDHGGPGVLGQYSEPTILALHVFYCLYPRLLISETIQNRCFMCMHTN